MDDVLTNVNKIERLIDEIDTICDNIPDSADHKAITYSAYDRAIAIASAKIKNGLIKHIEDFDGTKIPISASPANLIPIYAKGVCYKEAYDKIQGEAGYKGLISTLDARKAQLNGRQSITKVIQ